MLKLKYLLFVTLFSVVTFAEPCKPHRGGPLPWEGSGLCTGNNQLVIPFETTQLTLIHNSIDSGQDYGFGLAAWRLSLDHRLIDESNSSIKKVTLDRGDGSQIEFKNQVNGVWTASPLLSKAKLAFVTGLWFEKDSDGSQILYAPYPGNFWGSIAVVASNGNRTIITRNSIGQITEITDPFGRKIKLEYQSGRAASLKDYQGKLYYFSYKQNSYVDYNEDESRTYDNLFVLSEVARPDGTGRLVSYAVGDSSSDEMDYALYLQFIGLVSKLTEPNGGYTEYRYNDIERTYEDGSLPINIGVLGGSHAFPDGIWRFYAYTKDSAGMGSEFQSITENFTQGRLVFSKINGVKTEIVLKTSGPATGLPGIVTNSIGQTTVYDYDENLNVTYVKNENGLVTTIVYENYNPTLIKTFNGSQLVKTVSYIYKDGKVINIKPSDEDEQGLLRDSKGNITTVVKDGVSLESFTYDDKSLVTSKTDLITVQTTKYSYTNGYLTSVTDSLGNSTTYLRNALGLPTKIINANGTIQAFDYDELGQVVYDSTVGPSAKPLTVTTTRKLGQTTASFSYAKRGTINASFNIVPLLTKILPWKSAYAEDGLVAGSSVVRETSSNGAQIEISSEPGQSGPVCGCMHKDPKDTAVSQTVEDHGDKPVIYLYPEKNQTVKVLLEFLGKLHVTYPEYNAKKGWNVEARPDGTLTDLKDGKEYSYLFWEGRFNNPLDIDYSKGFIVAGKDTRKFLQETLAEMGLTPKEYNEFIVYWYPRLKDNAFNYIHFAGKPYTDNAKLDITPKPDSMLRVFMAFKPLESATEMKVTAQEFPKFVRKGFVVVEWGGGEVGGPDGLKTGQKVATNKQNRVE